MSIRYSPNITEPPSESTSLSNSSTGITRRSCDCSCGTSQVGKLITGQERYGNMTRVYYREAVGALVIFDMTRASTFQAVLKWKGDLDSKVALGNGRPVPAVLLGNKCDQLSTGLCSKLPKLENFTRDHGFVGWYETSAKDNTNIDAAIMCLVESIMAVEEERPPAGDPRDPSVLVLPRFDYNRTGMAGLPGCDGCKKRPLPGRMEMGDI
eukprot:XP_014062894.1 PREDICTED: ras-related protein Rab-38-like isoform X3 [Salmo salar]